MTTQTDKNKSKHFLLSEQVKTILHAKGFSKLFNYNDYSFFKAKVKNSFNKAQDIVRLFIAENTEIPSDFNEYIF